MGIGILFEKWTKGHLHEVIFVHLARSRNVRVLGNALLIIPSPLSVMADLNEDISMQN
jgi:hypothetical protein